MRLEPLLHPFVRALACLMGGCPEGTRSRLAWGASPFLTDVAEYAVYPATGTLQSARRVSHQVLQAALDIGIDWVMVETTLFGLAGPTEMQERAQLALSSTCLEFLELVVVWWIHIRIQPMAA